MKYFSMFSGIGGFELGIEKAGRITIKSKEENTPNAKGDKSISKGQQERNVNPEDSKHITTSKNTSRTLLQNGQESCNSNTVNLEELKISIEIRPQIRQRGYGVLRERDGIRNDKEGILRNRISPNIRKWECIGFSEIDKYAIATYKKHFPTHKNHGNARDINPKELPDFDLLCGGFPCQSFSIAGKRKGFQDTRGTLFHEICRIVAIKKPRFLFLENVKGLLSADNGRCFATIITSLDELGYNVEWQVLNSKNFGVPQNRERVFIIGHLRGSSSRQIFPISGTSEEPDKWASSLQHPGHSGGNYKGMNMVRAVLTPDRAEKRQNGRRIKEDGEPSFTLTGQDIHGVMIPEATKQGYAIAEEGDSINLSVPSLKTRRGRVGKGVAQTIDTGMQQHTIQNARIRRLTPIECERLQGFPDNWTIGSDTQRYKQCGNAVTVNVIEAIAKRLIQT